MSRKPGPELDAEVAEMVMGCKPQKQTFRGAGADEYKCGCGDPYPHNEPSYDNVEPYEDDWIWAYSTDIGAAWKVVERMCELFPERPLRIGRRWGDGGMHARCDADLGKWWDADAADTAVRVRGDTAPHAICLAALEAVERASR